MSFISGEEGSMVRGCGWAEQQAQALFVEPMTTSRKSRFLPNRVEGVGRQCSGNGTCLWTTPAKNLDVFGAQGGTLV